MQKYFKRSNILLVPARRINYGLLSTDKEKETNIKTQKYSVPDLKLISVSQKPIQTVNS